MLIALPLRHPHFGVFTFTLLHLPLDFIRVSSLRPTYLHPFGRPFTYAKVSFKAWDRPWYPMLWSQRRSRVSMEQKSRFKFLHWPGPYFQSVHGRGNRTSFSK